MSQKWKSFEDFIKILRVEPFMIMFMLSLAIKMTTMAQLFQDKICINDLLQDEKLCLTVATNSDPTVAAIRTKVLSGANVYKQYQDLILAIPSLATCLFLGPWTDRYVSARKIVMVLGSVAIFLNAVTAIVNVAIFELPTPWLLLATAFPSLVGGTFALMAAVWSYATNNTPKHLLALRFGVLQLAFFLGAPVAGYLGGVLLQTEPWFIKDRLRNYMGVFVVSLIASSFCILWVMFAINEKPKSVKRRDSGGKRSEDEEDFKKADADESFGKMMKAIFDLNNVRALWAVLAKKRPNRGHVQLWLLIYCTCTIYLIVGGVLAIGFTFSEKVYEWDATSYSKYFSIMALFVNLSSITVITLLVKVLKVSNITLGIIGIVSLSLEYGILGIILSPAGFVISHLAGLFVPCAAVGLKTAMTALVPMSESGSLFSLISLGQTLMTLCATYFYTSIFNATMDTMPGLAYEVAASILLTSLVGLVWIFLLRKSIKNVRVDGDPCEDPKIELTRHDGSA